MSCPPDILAFGRSRLPTSAARCGSLDALNDLYCAAAWQKLPEPIAPKPMVSAKLSECEAYTRRHCRRVTHDRVVCALRVIF